MKNTALILVCAFALSTAESGDVYPNGCPKDWSVEQLFPHNSCYKFYQCWDGKLVVHTCPSKLFFSIEQNRCEWAKEVDCTGREVPDDKENEGETCNNCNPEQPPGNCICDSGNGSEDNGGNGNEDNGDDDDGSGGGTCNCNPEEAPAICAADGSDGEFIAHEKCNQFYICSGGKPVALRCPGNLLFNPFTNQCDWADNVDCGDRVIPDGDCDDNGNGDSGDGDNGDGDNGDGDNGEDGGTCNCNPEEAPTICAADDSDGEFIAHEKCNQFYICSGGKPIALRCPGNLLFNPFTNQCDWADNVDCGDRVIPDGDCDDNGNGGNGDGDNGDNGNGDNGDGDDGEGGGTCNCNPEEAPAICAADGSDGEFIAHEKCNQFYICSGGKPVALRCPGNLLFNPFTNQCDWADNVDCGDRVIPDGDCDDNGNGDSGDGDNGDGDNGDGDNGEDGGTCNCNPEEAPTICAADDSDGEFIAHEKCNQFYICSGGKPIALRCPGNLLFNPFTNQCDWADNVDCGDRVIPDGDCDDNGNGGNGDGDNGDNGNGDNGDGDDGEGGGTCNCNPEDAPTICDCDDNGNGDNGDGDNGEGGGTCNCNPEDAPTICDCDDNGNGGNGDGDNGDNGNGDNGDGDNGDGDNGSGGGTCNCNPEEAPTICAADDSDGEFIAHEKCNQFYICSGGKPIALRCPGNLLFNPFTNQCDWADNVDCGDRVIPDGDCDDNGNGGNGDGDNGDNGNGDNGDGDDGEGGGTCNCNPEDAPTICDCDDNGNGDNGDGDNGEGGGTCNCNPEDAPTICDCDDNGNGGNGDGDNGDNGNGDNGDNGNGDNGDGDNGDGDNGSGGGTCNCNPEEAPTICAADDSDGEFIAHEKCNQFYICSGGKPIALRCPGNLLFNPFTNQCDWADNVDCGDRVIPDGDCDDNGNGGNGDGDNGDNGNGDNGDGDNGEGGGTCNCNPEDAPTICDCHDNGNGDNGDGDNGEGGGTCNCNPEDAPTICDCDDNGNGGNGDGDNGDNGNGDNGNGDNGDGDNGSGGGTCNCNPEEAPTICAADDSDGEFIAHEKCNQFYICSGGKPIALRCPGNLLFNPFTNQCDWADNVDCGDRVIPDGDCDDNGNGGNGDGDNGDNGNGDSGNGDNGEGGGTCNCNPEDAPTICDCHDNGNGDNGDGDNGEGGGTCNCNPEDAPTICDCDDNGNGGNGDGDNGDNGNGDNGDGDNGDGDNGSGGGTCNCNPEEAPTICAADDSDGEFIAHEKCNQFYICSGGKPIALRCPGNLLFNPFTNQCDWADNVDCGDRVIPDGDCDDNGNGGNGDGDNGDNGNGDSGNGDNGEGGGTCNCNPEDAPTICDCHDNGNGDNGDGDNGEGGGTCNCNPEDAPTICDCDDNGNGGNGDGDNGDNGNGDNGNGDNGDGDNGSGGGTCNCNPEEAPTICAADDSDGEFIAHEKCNQFYICSGGKPIALRCPGNLLFNPFTNQCDWADNVDCGDRVIPDGDCDNNGNGGNDEGDNGDNGNGDNDDGDNSNGGGTCNCNPEEAPAICAAEGSDGVLIAHERCNYFYICNAGTPLAQRCPKSLLFNPYTDQCDWAENVKCGGNDNTDAGEEIDNNELSCTEPIGGAGNNDPRLASTICSSENSDGVLVAHENCNKFYICDNSTPVAVTCPATLMFNPYNDRCDWSHCVKCNNQVYDRKTAVYTSLNKHLSTRQAMRFL